MFLHHGTRICHVRKVYGPHIVLDVFPALIDGVPDLVRDIMVVNIGTWYDPGNPAEYQQDVERLAEAMQRLRSQLPRQLLWADTPPQHFQYEKGYGWHDVPFGHRGIHDHCVFVNDEEHRQGGWSNLIARPIMAGIPVAILNSWNISTALWEWHVGMMDCTHFCHPSVYEIWLVILHDMLSSWPDEALLPTSDRIRTHVMW